MAQRRSTRARRQDPEEEEGRSRHARSQSPNLAPVVGVIATVAVLGVGFAIYSNQNKKPISADDGPSSQSLVDPFAGIEAETGPSGLSPGGKRTGLVERSPAGLLDDPVWVAAATTANEWIDKHNQAQLALKAKDNDTYLTLARQVRGAFNELLEETAEWEIGLSSAYGENDIRVRRIMRERDKWFAIAGKYRGL